MLRWVFEAIKFGDRKEGTFKLIRQHFADIHQLVDGSGCSLLHTAANSRNTQVMEFIFTLYQQTAITDPQSFNGQHKQEWVNQRDNRGFTALHYAVFRQELKVVQLLERQGGDIYLCSGDGLNCLHLAAQGGSPLLMYYFMGKGMKIGATDSGGSTPLHWACYSAAENAVSALIAWGSELDAQENVHGATPLHLAVISGSTRIVKWLLLAGCDRSIVNKKGQTARDLAIQKKDEHIAEIIEDKLTLLSLFNIKTRYRPVSRRGFPFYFLVCLFILSFAANVIYIYPPESAIQSAMIIASFIIGLILSFVFVFLGVSDPGHLPKNGDEGLMNLLRRAEFNRICYRCNIIRPVRSRHCTICGQCISVYDHHCPWIGNCIGSANYFRFFIFLVMLAGYLIYNIVYHIENLLYMSQSTDVVMILKIVASVINLLLGAIFTVPLLYLIFINARNASKNRTSFEANTKSFNPNRLKSIKAMAIEMQLSDKMSVTTTRTKATDHLVEPEEVIDEDVLANCVSMCFKNDNVPQYRHA